MTLEEKIAHLQETVMTEARSEGNAIIDNHKKRLNLYLKSIKKKRPHSLRSVSNPRP